MAEASTAPLTRQRKRELDRIILNIAEYVTTPQGEELLKRMEAVMKPTQEPVQLLPKLSDKESRALAFIQRELKRGHSPTVRQVAQAVGLRSSRSGMKLVRSLRLKGVVQ